MRVHISQAYSKMDVTRERISRILELREILRENSLRPYNLTVRTVRRKGVLQPPLFSQRFVGRSPKVFQSCECFCKVRRTVFPFFSSCRLSDNFLTIGFRDAGSSFADVIDGLAGEEEELANLVEHLDKASQPTAWRSVPRRPS